LTQRKQNTVITDATDSNIATTISNYINAILQNYMQEVNQPTKQLIKYRRKPNCIYNSELKSVFTFVRSNDSDFNVGFSYDDLNIDHSRKGSYYGGSCLAKPFVSHPWKSVPYIFLSIINAVIDFRRTFGRTD
jgi:ABC-2 type transport system permease protein